MSYYKQKATQWWLSWKDIMKETPQVRRADACEGPPWGWAMRMRWDNGDELMGWVEDLQLVSVFKESTRF